MQSHLNQHVAQAKVDDRVRAARERRRSRPPSAPPARAVRRSAAIAVARVARRLDPETARRVTAA